MIEQRRWILIAAIFLGSFVVMLDVSIVNVALPTIEHSLKSDIAGLQWVVSAYTLCLSAFLLTAGALGDRYGRRRVWTLGLATFIIGSAICSFAADMPALIGGRVVQGIGGALLIPGPLSILSRAFPDREQRAHVIGAWSSFSGISLITGPLIGGFLIAHFGWHSIFLINLPVGLITLILGIISIPESADPAHTSLDPVGQVLSVLGLAGLSYGLIRGGDIGWSDPVTLGLLGGALLLFGVFIAAERRIEAPMLPIELFRISAFRACIFGSFVIGFAAFSSPFFLSLYFQQVQGLSVAETGLRLTPQFAALALVSSISGRLVARIGAWRNLFVGFLGMTLSLGAMIFWSVDLAFVMTLPWLLLLGAGMGMTVPTTSTLAMSAAPPTRTGTASATINVARQAGLSVGIALIGAIMSTAAIQALAAQIGSAVQAANLVKAPSATTAISQAALSDLRLRPEALLTGFHWAAGTACIAAAAVALFIPLRTRRS